MRSGAGDGRNSDTGVFDSALLNKKLLAGDGSAVAGLWQAKNRGSISRARNNIIGEFRIVMHGTSIFPTASSSVLLMASPVFAQGNGTGYLKTKMHPGRAGVFGSGKCLGLSANSRVARKYSFPAGECEVTLSGPGCRKITRKVKIEPDQAALFSQELQPVQLARPSFGQLHTTGGKKYATVYAGGKYIGHFDEFDGPGERFLPHSGSASSKMFQSLVELDTKIPPLSTKAN